MVALGGVTSTDATGIGTTVTADVPLFPSDVAVIVTGPPAILPLTRPFASTVAIVASLVCHVTVRPVSGLPFASFGVAVSCRLALTRMLEDAGVTVTDATGMGVTVTADVPLLPSAVAVIVSGPPPPFAATTPFVSTVAMVVSLVCQVTVRPVSGLPLASFRVALNWTVAFTATLAVAGRTTTDATGIGVTVTADVPLLPSLVAVIVTGPPTAFAVTRPFASTVAIVASLVCHVTVRPVSGLPVESFGVAVSWTVAFSCTLGVAGVTATAATGTGETVI